MAGETTITVIGNLTDDPELRFTPSGAAVAKFRIASTPRTLDRAAGAGTDRRQTSCHGPTVAASPEEVSKSCVITKSW